MPSRYIRKKLYHKTSHAYDLPIFKSQIFYILTPLHNEKTAEL